MPPSSKIVSRSSSSASILKRRIKKDKIKDDSPKLSAKEAFRAFVYDTLKNVFSLTVKEDGDMNVTIDNVFPLMKSLELDTKDEVMIDMVHEACIETFGNIDILELDDNIMKQRQRVRGEEFEQDIRSAFRMIDVDNDGFITVPDLYQLMMGIGDMLTDDELTELLVTADNDGDGMVDYKDFKFFLTGELSEDTKEEENKDEAPKEQETNDQEETQKTTEGNTKENDTNDEKQEGSKPETKDEKEELKPETNDEKEEEPKPETKDETEEKPKPEAETKDETEEKPKSEAETEGKKQDVLSKEEEEEEERKARELKKRKSVLWMFASQKSKEVKTEEVPKEEPKPSSEMEPVKEEEETSEKDEEEKEPRFITSVSVSIKEKEPREEHEPEPQNDKTENVEKEPEPQNDKTGNVEQNEPVPKSNITENISRYCPPKRPTSTLARRRSLMSEDSMDSCYGQSVVTYDDGQSETATDEGFASRTHSARSRKSNFPSRPSTGKSLFGESIAESAESNLDDEGVFENGEKELTCDFNEQMNERQKEFLEHGIEQQIYCEAGVERKEEITRIEDVEYSSEEDSLDLESIIDDDPSTITPRINLTRLKSNPPKGKPKLRRSKSAHRLRTFRKIENVLLCRQNTDPRLDIEHIRAANDRLKQQLVKTQNQKTNSNGMFCTHISIDLDVQPTEQPKPRVMSATLRNRKYPPKPRTVVSAHQSNSRRIISRPQTAMTFHEAEKINHVYSKSIDLHLEKSKIDRDIKIIDLSKSVSIDTDRFEKPGLSSHHHGYKSVLPLGRVLSGYRNKINQGNGIVLNSISRKLERIDYISRIAKERQSDTQQYGGLISPTLTNQPQRQAVITLELPDNVRQRNCRRYTQSNNNTHRPLIKT